MNRVKLTAIILIVFALGAWIGVGYAAQMIRSTALTRANDTKQALTKANQASVSQRVLALAQNTKEKRDELDSLAGTDVVSVIETIEAAGKSSGITSKVSDAAVAATQAVGKTGDSIRTVVFNVQGEGTYSQVMHAATLYERLPLLSYIEQMDIERNSTTNAKSVWRISARIRVMTLIQVSI